MNVVYAPAALRDLDGIYEWNRKTRGPQQAAQYVAMLDRRMTDLGTAPERGQAIGDDPNRRYLVMQKRPKGDGHVAAYLVDQAAQTVQILRIYHTKQDWQTYLESELP